jgi:hypothetical protein
MAISNQHSQEQAFVKRVRALPPHIETMVVNSKRIARLKSRSFDPLRFQAVRRLVPDPQDFMVRGET